MDVFLDVLCEFLERCCLVILVILLGALATIPLWSKLLKLKVMKNLRRFMRLHIWFRYVVLLLIYVILAFSIFCLLKLLKGP